MSLLEYFTKLAGHIWTDIVTKPGVSFLVALLLGYGARIKVVRRWMLAHPELHLVSFSRWMERWDRWIFNGLVGGATLYFIFLYGYANYLVVLDAQSKDATNLAIVSRRIVDQQKQIDELRRREDERRTQRGWDLKKAHLDQLRPLLGQDALYFTNLVKTMTIYGRIATDRTPEELESDLSRIFADDNVFSKDLHNHWPQYAAERDQLRKDIKVQEDEFDTTALLVSKALTLAPIAEARRMGVAHSLVLRCIGKGPDTILITSATNYSYQAMSGGVTGNGAAPADIIEAAKAFDSARLDEPQVIRHCNGLKKRADSILFRLKNHIDDAKQLAAKTTLPGECEYTKPD